MPSLEPGTRLGPYRVVAKLGEGGMGEVYRAHDTTLGRDVAIKVLPPAVAADAERLARFEREARVLAALNHPHIAQIYGFDRANGAAALVMELVEGEDLSQRLARGAMTIAEALPVARQIAEALEAAHERGIVHRDLKPANVKISAGGTAKVLDFGLAKALTPIAAPALTSTSPAMTATGVILGTAAYMAPEQARGAAVDRRADIWAFGCVLYEMLCGRPPFAGGDVTDLLAAIVRDAPDLAALPGTTPTPVSQLIERCLEKDPRERLRDIGEARILLGHPARRDVSPAPARRRPLTWVPIAVAGVLAGGVGARSLLPQRVERPATIASIRQLTEAPGPEINPDISPDGRQVLFAAGPEGARNLCLLRVGGGRAINLTGANSDNVQGTFSPDGDRIAFRSSREGGGLFVMGATGESVRRLTSSGADPRWSPDGKRLAYATEAVSDPYSRITRSELWTADVDSGATRKLWSGDGVQPAWSPHGQRIAFWANTSGQRDIWTLAASGGTPVAVTTDAATDWAPEWSPDGRWVYFVSDRGGSPNLWRIAVDESTGAARGAPEPVTNGVRGMASARFSRDGSRMVLGAVDRNVELLLSDFDVAHPDAGAVRQMIRSTSLGWCSPSRDASWLACTSRTGQEDLVLLRADGSETRRLTDDAFKDRIPVWTPDDKALVFMSARTGRWQLWTIGVDGAGLHQLTALGDAVAWGAVSPDGRRLALAAYSHNPFGAWLVDLAKTETTAPPFTPIATRMDIDSWSSDGTLLTGTEGDGAGNPARLILWDLSAQRLHRQVELPLLRSTSLSAAFVPGTHDVLVNTTDGVALVNGDTGQWRVIRKMEAPFETRISGDGRTLLVERAGTEEDLWLMEFGKR